MSNLQKCKTPSILNLLAKSMGAGGKGRIDRCRGRIHASRRLNPWEREGIRGGGESMKQQPNPWSRRGESMGEGRDSRRGESKKQKWRRWDMRR
jgi:hypothetical protein